MSDTPEQEDVETGSDENVSPGADSYQQRTAEAQEEGMKNAPGGEPSTQTDETSE
jgi:hypothetical protein